MKIIDLQEKQKPQSNEADQLESKWIKNPYLRGKETWKQRAKRKTRNRKTQKNSTALKREKITSSQD